MSRLLLIPFLGLGLSACGGGVDLGATLLLPEEPRPELTITPALDLSGIVPADWGERLVIERIALYLDDARLLGADPRIPSGGLSLLESPRVLAGEGTQAASTVLAFPAQFLGTEDLAVFLRVAPSAELQGAAVEVHARLYASPPGPLAFKLTTEDRERDEAGDPGSMKSESERDEAARPDAGPEGEAVDPDGEPAQPEGEAVDPDGEPAQPEGEAVDPDGEPAQPEKGTTLDPYSGPKGRELPLSEHRHVPSVAFVLRDDLAADMVAGLGPRGGIEIVVGIPGSRWLTAEVVDQLERASRGSSAPDPSRVGVLGAPLDLAFEPDARPTTLEPNPFLDRSYFLTSDERVDRHQLRRDP